MRALAHIIAERSSLGASSIAHGAKAVGSWINAHDHNISAAGRKSSGIVASSGCCPSDWREYWRAHGTSWRSLFKLHCSIVDRLRSNSSLWVWS